MRARRAKVYRTPMPLTDFLTALIAEKKCNPSTPRRHPSGGLRRLTKGPRFDKYGQRIPRLMSFTDEERAEWVEEERYLRSMWTR